MNMKASNGLRALLGSVLALATYASAAALAGGAAPLAIDSARVTISGTSNIHAYTATTTTVRIRKGQLAAVADGANVWESALKPGGVELFEIAIPAATLTSPREGLDANMHKALKVIEHPDIVFRLLRLEPGQGGALKGIGNLKIAGVVREVALDLTTERKGTALSVRGQVTLLMTDFGVTPPIALMGMLKTDPKVTVTFETLLAEAPIMTTQQH
jgi:polyisoprenoid-binding protein YceI